MERQTLDTKVERELDIGINLQHLAKGQTALLSLELSGGSDGVVPGIKEKIPCLITSVDEYAINYIASCPEEIVYGCLTCLQGRITENDWEKRELYCQGTGDLAQDAIYNTLVQLLNQHGIRR